MGHTPGLEGVAKKLYRNMYKVVTSYLGIISTITYNKPVFPYRRKQSKSNMYIYDVKVV